MIKANQKYNGTVREGSCLTESGTGTVGYQVMLECEDGDTSFMIWLTAKNKERAQKQFVDGLGVNPDQLQDPNYFEYQMGQDIVGREVSFGTSEDEYKGKKTIKVAWIGKKSESLDGGLSSAAARFFGGKAREEDEIPF